MSSPAAAPQESKSYRQMAGEYYNAKYEAWMPWIEDQYLAWFTKDNKASYATKQSLDSAKVTGVSQIDAVQDSLHSTVAGQLGQQGLARPLGDVLSKEGVNRAERGGKDEQGRDALGYGTSAVEGVKGGVQGLGGMLGVGGSGGQARK